MSVDRRGFVYALEPVRSLTAWEIDEIAAELAPLNAEAAAAAQRSAQLQGQFAAARAEVMQQRSGQAALDISGERRAHEYMVQVQRMLQLALIAQREAEDARDAVYKRLVEARKRAESLDKDKEHHAGEHDQKVAKQGYQESDDNWLQRIHWRKSQ